MTATDDSLLRAATAEQQRLDANVPANGDGTAVGVWYEWGPYLSERAWGSVREDYSDSGDAWSYFPHDHARSRAYRWNEDGLAGLCDVRQRLCLALAVWNDAYDAQGRRNVTRTASPQVDRVLWR